MPGTGNPPVRVAPEVHARLLALKTPDTNETISQIIARLLRYYENSEGQRPGAPRAEETGT